MNIKIYKKNNLKAIVNLCNDAKSRGTGLLTTKELSKNEEENVYTGILMEVPDWRKQRSGFVNSIHMIGMKYPIFVMWVDEDNKVTDTCIAEPGLHIYSPKHPCSCTIELETEAGDCFEVGDKLEFLFEDGTKYSCRKNK